MASSPQDQPRSGQEPRTPVPAGADSAGDTPLAQLKDESDVIAVHESVVSGVPSKPLSAEAKKDANEAAESNRVHLSDASLQTPIQVPPNRRPGGTEEGLS